MAKDTGKQKDNAEGDDKGKTDEPKSEAKSEDRSEEKIEKTMWKGRDRTRDERDTTKAKSEDKPETKADDKPKDGKKKSGLKSVSLPPGLLDTEWAKRPKEKTQLKPYWLGTLPSSPVHHTSAGGTAFQAYTEKVEGSGQATRRTRYNGAVEYLSEPKVKLLQERLARKVVRWNASQTKGVLMNSNDKRYRRREHDVPLAHYLYMVPIKDNMPTNWRETLPEPIVS